MPFVCIVKLIFYHNNSCCVNSSTAEYNSLKLVGGNNNCSGTVTLQRDYKSGTICNYYWDLKDAGVLCKQLDCGYALSTGPGAQIGILTGLIWKTNFNCIGNESLLWDCPASFWEKFSCTHDHDVTVVCSGTQWHLRLESGGSRCDGRGRVEVFYNGTWGTVCSDSMGMDEAEVICKQLDCGRALDVEYDGKFDEGSGPIWLDDMECNSKEYFLWQCSSRPWGEHNCAHSDDVGQEMRLVGGSSICSGRVEILSNKTWGTVCDDSWDIREAGVVCGQLDCGPAVRAVGQAGFGQGAGQIWLDELHCRGSESFLSQHLRNEQTV
uniref:SRCR domain-containing protein n=1 Tax=Callorhinchus milii TaxID=7868 RepID=A0A4W3GRA8_CALMI